MRGTLYSFACRHIVSDDWSKAILTRELTTLYSAFVRQSSPNSRRSTLDLGPRTLDPALPPLPVQYADYAYWQRRHLAARVQEQIGYWQERLEGLQPLELPTDRLRPTEPSHQGDTLSFSWAVKSGRHSDLLESLHKLSRQSGVTLFMTLLGGFQVLLHRLAGQQDVSVGTPIANRGRSEVQSLIGFFLNTLVMRLDLSGNPTFGQVLQRLRRRALEAYSHQDVPFEQVVEALDPDRSLSRSPLFQVMFTFLNLGPPSGSVEGLQASMLPVPSSGAKFDLVFSLWETPTGLTGACEYSTELWDSSTLRRWIGHLRRLFEAAARDPDRPIADLPLLEAAGQQQLLREWNPPRRQLPHKGVAAHFVDQAETIPDALALVEPLDAPSVTLSVSYAELKWRSGQVAAKLQKLGVGPEVRVGVFLERCSQRLISQLAVARAGGAVLPLDPDPGFPDQRLAYLIENSRASVLISRTGLLQRLPRQAVRVAVDEPGWDDHLGLEGDLTNVNEPQSLGYVIYTSGSTGRPKGVMLSQKNLARMVMWQAGLTGGQRTLHYSSLTFDVSFQEIFSTWCSGGALVLVSEELRRDAPALLKILARHQVEALFLPVVALHQLSLAYESEPVDGLTLRHVLAAGEQLLLTPSAVRWLDGLPNCRLHNHYGPSETHSAAAYTRPGPIADWPQRPPVGRPMPYGAVYLTDADLRPVPVGVAGELCIAGEGVGRGYLDGPSETASKFLPDPFDPIPGSRLYRSGDLARWLGDGNIEFLGRFDHQVKLRGYRVELGEIEALLGKHPDVRQAAVAVRQGRLVGYVSGRSRESGVRSQEEGGRRNRRERGDGTQRGAERSSLRPLRLLTASSAVSPPSLRSHLQTHLPEYMVPTLFMAIDELPLTPSGKVDRKALPEPSLGDLPESGFGSPRTAEEEVLCGIWAEVLGIRRVGAGESFFELGGHSLLATQAISRIRKAFRIELPLSTLFEAPRPRQLAQRIRDARRSGCAAPTPPIRPADRRGDIPLSHAQQRLWFLDQLQPSSALYNLPTALQLRGRLNVAALRAGLQALVQRHETLRTCFPSRQGQPVQHIHQHLSVALPLIDLTALEKPRQAIEQNRLTQQEAQRPFDLSRGPLLRAALVLTEKGRRVQCPRSKVQGHPRSGTAQSVRSSQFAVRSSEPQPGTWNPQPLASSVLLLTLHHIITDAWSMDILVREWTKFYQRFAHPDSLDLGPWTLDLGLPLHYADFAIWQRQWLNGEVLEVQMDYWRQRLQGVPPLELPTDRPRPIHSSFRGGSISFVWPADLADKLGDLSRGQDTTLFMTLLTAVQALLRRWSGQDDVAVGTPIANRNREEIEGLIGFFVNTLVMRNDLSGDPTFAELLQRVRETALQAYAHQDIPFEAVVEALQPQRSLNRTPLFQVMFALQNAPSRPVDVEGLEISGLESAAALSKFDLTLTLTEVESGLAGNLEYSADLFDACTIRRLAGHFRNLAQTIGRERRLRLSEIPLMSAAERHQVMTELPRPAAVWPSQAVPDGIGGLVRDQIVQRGSAVAAVFAEQHLTYGELGRRAGLVATCLAQQSIRSDSLVGVMADRSLEMVAAFCGILQAGAAYLPLDPEFPAQRLEFMLMDTQADAILVQQSLRGRLPSTSLPDVELETLFNGHPGTTCQDWRSSPPDSLAYVIYTSGSTGHPKGVAIPHRAIPRLLISTDYILLNSADRMAQAASSSFDAITFELWGALANGSCLVGVDRETLLSPRESALWMQRQAVTCMFLTTALFNRIAAEQPQAFRNLGNVLFGGEASDPGAVQHVLKSEPPRRLLHVYGPTETTTFASWFEVQESLKPKVQSPRSRVRIPDSASGLPTANCQLPTVPIGRPLTATSLYVLDYHHQPVPLGVVGELCIGGEGLARGYLNRPALTAERFIPHPMEAGKRLYRSGDLARWRRDALEFVGRFDHQIKIRGFRIELGEIEAVIVQHPEVHQAVVAVREERLVAYVVGLGGEREREGEGRNRREHRDRAQRVAEKSSLRPLRLLSASSAVQSPLRRHLQQHLPPFMVPSDIIQVEAFPLTPGGKIDREAVVSLEAEPGSASTDNLTPTQELLTGIWSDLLGIETVGLEDNFFERGGHSLLATRLAARIRAAFEVDLPLKVLFEHPVLDDLAQRIETACADQSGAVTIPAIGPVERSGHLPLSFAQQRLWMLDRIEPGLIAYNIPIALQLSGELHFSALQAAMQTIVERHEVLRTDFPESKGRPIQRIHPHEPFSLPLVDLTSLDTESRQTELSRLNRQQANRPFTLSQAPLYRAWLVRLGKVGSWRLAVGSSDPEPGTRNPEPLSSSVLLLTMHHIITDGWSMEILTQELSALYQTHCELRTANRELPALPIQYADYAAWQRDWLGGGEMERQVRYWSRKLSDLDPSPLHTDRQRSQKPDYRGAYLDFSIDSELLARLQSVSRAASATLFMTLAAALKILISRRSGSEQVSLGTPVSNRQRPEVEHLIGFFVNTLVLRSDLSGDPTFRDFLARLRRTALQAYAHQEVPFDHLVEALHPERLPGREPFFQVMLSYHRSVGQRSLDLPGLRIKPLQSDHDTVQRDLTLTVSETSTGLHATWSYSTALFKASTIQSLSNSYQTLLANIAANPDARLSQLELFSEEEKWRQESEKKKRRDHRLKGLRKIIDG